MPFQAKVILDSIGPAGNRLTTIEFTIPKPWNGEFNTHCMFARNSASTRAIPYARQRERLLQDTFIPEVWPLEGKGMSASQYEQDPEQIKILRELWLCARDKAIKFSDLFTGPPKPFRQHPIHKQLAGRLLELWQFHTVLVTGDSASYANFFHQRRDAGAAPEIRAAANKMWEVYSVSVPQTLGQGQWHTPLLQFEDWRPPYHYVTRPRQKRKPGPVFTDYVILTRVSAARCARLSYLTHHGVRDIEEDIALFHRLTQSGHWSPLEHVCQALPKPNGLRLNVLKLLGGQDKMQSKWNGWKSLRSTFPGEYVKEYHP